MRHLVFLKLGGSLITEKSRPYTARIDQIEALSATLADALRTLPRLSLVLGHGSGSFGHHAAQEGKTQNGIATHSSPETRRKYWQGFTEVAHQAATLHRLVMESLHRNGVPAISFPPSAMIYRQRSGSLRWNLAPLRSALKADLVPVLYGDVIFDGRQGGSILSTEEVFEALALHLHPARILLAGLEDGVWADFPQRTQLIPLITSSNFERLRPALGAAEGIDVTGGMLGKVQAMLRLTCRLPGLRIFLFSARDPARLKAALQDQAPGTWITCT